MVAEPDRLEINSAGADATLAADHGRADRWRDHAECKGRTSLFFPRRAERPEARKRREMQANRLCALCPVVESCREFARNNREYGFWAGESEEERHRLGFTVAAPIGLRTRTPAARAV